MTGQPEDAMPWWEYWAKQNPTMPQTTKERQESLRARRLMEGMTEVRGIYLSPALHAELKAYAKKLQKSKQPPKGEP